MNAVFTIVAKNFLPQARILGDSIKQIHADIPFHILLSDETEGLINLTQEKYPTVDVKNIGIPFYIDMAFKYNLVEFATAVKPFFFEYLFNEYHYEKIIYFDPDICVYSSLTPIFDALDENFVILTPHIIKLGLRDEGARAENNLLYEGTYNLGFMALNCSQAARAVVEWWKDRLKDRCYADRFDGLHVDQKWMELIPAFFDKGVLISRHPGHNLAVWNMHERSFGQYDGTWVVDGQPLVFFHFAGFDPNDSNSITGSHKQTKYNLTNKPEYRDIFHAYAENLRRNQAPVTSYAYSKFDNGVSIFRFQRRLYRVLTENGLKFKDPFSTGQNSFYDLLRRNRLLIMDRRDGGEFRKTDFSDPAGKIRMLRKGMLLLKKIIGIKYYNLLMRTLIVLCRPEEQTFLFENLKLDIPTIFRE